MDRSRGLVSREPQAHSKSAPIHMGLPTRQWQHPKLGARQGAMSYALRHEGSSLSVRRCSPRLSTDQGQAPRKPMGPSPSAPRQPAADWRLGGKAEGDPRRRTELGAELEKPSSNCGRRAGSREPPRTPGWQLDQSRDGWSVHAAQISGSAEGKCLKQAVT